MLAYHTGIATVLLLAKPGDLYKKSIRCANHKLLSISVLIGLLGGILLLRLWPFLSIPSSMNSYLVQLGLGSPSFQFFAAYYSLVNPVMEEFFWRGYLGSDVKKPIIHDFLFAGYHVVVLAGQIAEYWLILVFLVVLLCGWYWRQTRRITRGLLTAILSHMAADLSIILAIYLKIVT